MDDCLRELSMKVAIIHYWLVGMRGGEKVLESLCKAYPEADIFTHVWDQDGISAFLNSRSIKTTFIDKLPFAKTKYQSYLPFMPLALEQLDLRGYDLVISSESGPAKGVITDPGSIHVCYCHSPMRYVWDMYHDYLDNVGVFKRLLMIPLLHYLRMWDVSTSARVDVFVSNSNFIKNRIKKFYQREAYVVHPPVSVDSFIISDAPAEYYLMVGQLTGYKKVDLAVRAFNASGKKLIVIGAGEQLKLLREIAGENVEVLGYRSFEFIKEVYSNCKALIFPGVEDFGIVPLEAMASGRPVIAYGAGGALDYVKDGQNGLLFGEQSIEGLQDAVDRFEADGIKWSPEEIRAFALQFSEPRFRRDFVKLVENYKNKGTDVAL